MGSATYLATALLRTGTSTTTTERKVFSPVEGAAEGTFQHAPESLEWLDDSDGTDYAALRRGAVSVTPLRLEGMFLSTEGTGDPLALRAATEPLVRAAFGESDALVGS